ncbi:MAG: EamA family transporter [Verrucomicrobiales bacterium]|nr:EamA family transporter [Verrucomicrobiales bacterium]
MRQSRVTIAVPWYLLLPLGSAIVYALSSVFIKRSLKEGATMDQSFHLTNWIVGLIFLPLLFFETGPVDWAAWWKPAIMAVTFFIGTWATFVGIRIGDVSLVTPLMGTKVVFVALGMALMLGQPPSPALWGAAILTAAGIFLMGWRDFRSKAHGMMFAILITLFSAAVFGISDVLVRWWAEDFGAMTFLATGSAGVGVCSLVMWILQGCPSFNLPKPARKPAVLGGTMMGLQAIGMGVALANFDDATGINVVYASRGLWAILLIAFLGAALGNHERKTAGRRFIWRSIGTVLLTAAVVIAVLDRSSG